MPEPAGTGFDRSGHAGTSHAAASSLAQHLHRESARSLEIERPRPMQVRRRIPGEAVVAEPLVDFVHSRGRRLNEPDVEGAGVAYALEPLRLRPAFGPFRSHPS